MHLWLIVKNASTEIKKEQHRISLANYVIKRCIYLDNCEEGKAIADDFVYMSSSMNQKTRFGPM